MNKLITLTVSAVAALSSLASESLTPTLDKINRGEVAADIRRPKKLPSYNKMMLGMGKEELVKLAMKLDSAANKNADEADRILKILISTETKLSEVVRTGRELNEASRDLAEKTAKLNATTLKLNEATRNYFFALMFKLKIDPNDVPEDCRASYSAFIIRSVREATKAEGSAK